MQRSNQAEHDAVTWSTAKLRLGERGLDLRAPTDGASLTKLINARFMDDMTIERRNGYTGIRVHEEGPFPQPLDENDEGISEPMKPDGWLYGHGQRLLASNLRDDAHLPIPFHGKGVFTYQGARVVWTGDRLLVVREDGRPALGSDDHFAKSDDGQTSNKYGIPAYLPVQTDSTPIDTVEGGYVETCLTDSLRFVIAAGSTDVTVWTTHRDTGALINKTVVDDDITPCDLRIFQSGAFVVALWRDSAAAELYMSHWGGREWSSPVSVGDACDAYDVALVDGGFHVAWRDGAEIFIGHFSGENSEDVPYAFASSLTLLDVDDVTVLTANGPVALDVAPSGHIVVAFEASNGTAKLYAQEYTSALARWGAVFAPSTLTTWNAGLTVKYQGLSNHLIANPLSYHYDLLASRNGIIDNPTVYYWRAEAAVVVKQDIRYNSQIVSKAFRVGNTTFCWLRSINSSTLYLIGVNGDIEVCGVADREEAEERDLTDTVRNVAQVVQDPRDEHTFTWARSYNIGEDYVRAGNARVGDMNFLPTFSAVQYGKSVYLAGSMVRNWDGKELGEAGFHDYPVVSTHSSSTSGGFLTDASTYRYRIYPVRYNAKGERFQGAAVTFTADPTGTSANTCYIELQIRTIPVTNHEDVVFEVYRTEAGGTTYYLDGTIENDLESALVIYTSSISDTDLTQDGNPLDPHETGVASLDELEEFGPLGCAYLAVASDRLWGAGGQVPVGRIQFSKLKETVEGAGFDALAGWQEIDCEGGEITSIAGFTDSLVVFERNKLQVLFGGGPDNYGNGGFGTPQLVLTDGAINHVGTGVTQYGILFWGVDGPRLLTPGYKVENICGPVRALTKDMDPTGLQIDLVRREAVWFTAEGDAVLLNFAGPAPRWAQWTGLKIAGCSQDALVTVDGVLLQEDEDALGDNGKAFIFAGCTGELDTEQLLLGHTLIEECGVVGKYLGPHRLRLRIYYNGSPMWSEQQVWDPTDKSWLTSVEDVADLTPAQVDALNLTDHTGRYAFHKRTQRHSCSTFRVEWSDLGAFRPTYRLDALVVKIGARGNLARIPAQTFTRS